MGSRMFSRDSEKDEYLLGNATLVGLEEKNLRKGCFFSKIKIRKLFPSVCLLRFHLWETVLFIRRNGKLRSSPWYELERIPSL